MTLSAFDRLAQVRRHAALGQLVLGAPMPVALAGVLWRFASPAVAVSVALAGIAALAALAWRRTRAFDTAWLVRQLDARRKDLDDSSDLLLAPPASLTPLQQLQQARVRDRLRSQPAPDLRTPWPWPRIVAMWLVAGVVIAVSALWPARAPMASALAPADEETPAIPGVPRLVGQRLHVAPPSYTGQPARDEATLDAKAPVGSRLAWTLRFEPQPTRADLVFHDGQRIALRRNGDTWRATHTLAKSTLYRVVAAGTEAQPPSKLRRLDAIPDRAPQVKVLVPDRGLSLVAVGQTRWALAFEARDDYGVAATATLKLTLAQGSGENIAFKEQAMTLHGTGPATSRRFTASLDLAALGMAVGDDLIAQLTVRDTRAPTSQTAQSPGLILRWPADLGQESTGLEGLVKKVMPAYFRSQRQIIIDAEALQKQKRSLATDTFVTRSDAIGVDQRILRLRYGQFLGEEAEEPGHEEEHDAGAPPAEENAATALVEQFGHVHDIPEAATLLDPETRKLLKSALDAMWQAEGELRLGRPAQALPHEYRALRFIKQVQQANRIYLARVGLELAPVDMARRLGGKREGIAPRQAPAVAPAADAPAPALALWTALQRGELESARRAAEAWEAQVGAEPDAEDALAVLAALDRWRADPRCDRCVADLRAALWPRLPATPAALAPRERADARGRAYLEALDAVDAPRANAPSATGDTP